MDWINLETEEQLNLLVEKSKTIPQLIFKHSTRCSISSMAKNRLDKSELPEGIEFHYLDLLRYRSLSGKISELFQVHHQSPQILLIKNGECIYDESHSGIRFQDIISQAKTAA